MFFYVSQESFRLAVSFAGDPLLHGGIPVPEQFGDPAGYVAGSHSGSRFSGWTFGDRNGCNQRSAHSDDAGKRDLLHDLPEGLPPQEQDPALRNGAVFLGIFIYLTTGHSQGSMVTEADCTGKFATIVVMHFNSAHSLNPLDLIVL